MPPCNHNQQHIDLILKGIAFALCPNCGATIVGDPDNVSSCIGGLYSTGVMNVNPDLWDPQGNAIPAVPNEAICTCEVPYEFAPYACERHGTPKAAPEEPTEPKEPKEPPKKTFKTIGPPPSEEELAERIEQEETRQWNSDQLDKFLVAQHRQVEKKDFCRLNHPTVAEVARTQKMITCRCPECGDIIPVPYIRP